MTSLIDLTGRVVVVTGAARGQGLTEAELCRDLGATVYAGDLESPVIDGIVGVELDVAREDHWARFAGRLAADGVHVDGLVNNAGVSGRSRLLDADLDEIGRVFGIDALGPLLGMKHLAPLMPEGASIVNTGSVAGLTAHTGVAYNAAKWALRGLSKAAALELGPRGIRVNYIAPGHIDTEMTKHAPPGFVDANIAGSPLGRGGTTSEVAALVAFLLSDASAFITGTEIPIDGGLTSHVGTKWLQDFMRDFAASR